MFVSIQPKNLRCLCYTDTSIAIRPKYFEWFLYCFFFPRKCL